MSEDTPTREEEKKGTDVEIVPADGEDASASDIKPWKARLKKKEAEIRSLKKQRDEIQDKYLRTLAEMDNLRKRSEREKSDYYQYALSDILKELLSVLDNFERAIESGDEGNGKSFQEGVKMIYKQFLDALAKNGVTPILNVEKARFDPKIHQALITEESEETEEPLVGQELQRGYMLHDRLLRPALVKVMVPKKS